MIIVTGFPITSGELGENDGRRGAVRIGALRRALGKKAVLVTDPMSHRLVQAGARVACPDVDVKCVPVECAHSECAGILRVFEPDCVIAIERPGKGKDGHFHNSRGECIDALIADTDSLLDAQDAFTVGIGDGGNELGMGACRAQVEQHVLHGGLICADKPATFTLGAGVSNWWACGLCALMSDKAGRDLMPSDEQETDVLQAVLQAGAVDGVTRKQTLTVDSIAWEDNLRILQQVRELTAGEGRA